MIQVILVLVLAAATQYVLALFRVKFRGQTKRQGPIRNRVFILVSRFIYTLTVRRDTGVLRPLTEEINLNFLLAY